MEYLIIIFKFILSIVFIFVLTSVIGAIFLNFMLEKMEAEEKKESEQ